GTKLVLANAAYFNGKWATAFDPKLTQPEIFTPANGRTVRVQMMTRQDAFAYQENSEFQAVELTYNGGVQMELFLPAVGSNPQLLLAELDSANIWTTVQNSFTSQSGTVSLPRFKLASNIPLSGSLQEMGMTDAFNGNANFSGITTGALSISLLNQQSDLEV